MPPAVELASAALAYALQAFLRDHTRLGLPAIVHEEACASGHLPISFPRSSSQIPVYYGHEPSGGRSHWKGDYVDGPTTPLYPFGHGRGYTTFAYEDLATRPVAELKGFTRVHLAPGEAKRVTFGLSPALMAFHDESMRLVVEPGEIEVMVGASSTDVRLSGAFTIAGEAAPVQQKVFASDVTVS